MSVLTNTLPRRRRHTLNPQFSTMMKANDSSLSCSSTFRSCMLQQRTVSKGLGFSANPFKERRDMQTYSAREESDAAPIMGTLPITQKVQRAPFFKPSSSSLPLWNTSLYTLSHVWQFKKCNGLAQSTQTPTQPTHDRLANRHGLVSASDSGRPGLFSVATNCSHTAWLVLALLRSWDRQCKSTQETVLTYSWYLEYRCACCLETPLCKGW